MGTPVKRTRKEKTEKASPQASELSFETIFNQLQDAVGVSSKGIHLFCNKAYANLFGYKTCKELIGTSIFDLISPGDRQRIEEFQRRRQSGADAPTVYVSRGVRRDGSEFDLEVRTSTFEMNGAPHTLVILRDFTEHKKTELELRHSEELNRRILQTVPGGVVLVSRDGAILQANEEAQRLLGLTFDAIKKMFVNDFDTQTIREDGSHFPASEYPVSKCLATGKAQPGTTLGVRRPDGSVAWAIFSAMPVIDPASGQQTGAVVTFIDISERKRQEEARRTSEEQYRSALVAIHEAVIVVDADGMMRACNPSCERMFGLKPDQMIGFSVVNPEWPSIREDGSKCPVDEYPAIQCVRESRPLSNVVHGLYTPDGKLIWIAMNAEPIFRPGETKASSAVVSITDITERKRAEAALRESEKRLEAIVSNTPNVAVEGYDIDGRVLYWNKAAEKVFGYTASEAVGKTLDQLILDSKSTQEFVALLRELDRSGTPLPSTEWSFKAANGVEGWLYSTIFPIPVSNGRKEFVCMDVDITPLKTAQRELARSLSLVQATLESTADGILVVNSEGKIENFNKKFIEMWRIPREILEDKNDAKAIAYVLDQLRDPEDFVRKVKEAYSQHDDATFDLLHFKDGRLFERYSQPQKVAGVYVGRVWSFRDVTARTNAEIERLALERKLLETQKLESLGVLAGGIAHDFNNLLAAVLGNVSLAAMQIPPDSPARPFLTSIETTTHRAAELCKQMLAYSGKGRFVVQPVHVNALIQEMAELLRISIGKSISLKFELAPNLPQISADATQLRQVLMNLILNASEAIPAGIPGVIRLASGVCFVDRSVLTEAYLAPNLPPGEYLFLEVVDTGCGMDTATQARIFDPFFSTKFTGRGLGLAAVLGIIRGHKGAIKVDSAPGRGTTFRILLPCESTIAAANARGLPAAKISGRLLIVEDDDTLRALQVRMVESAGMSTAATGDGRTAIHIFQSQPQNFSAVLLDVELPGMSGEEVCAVLLKLRPTLPILMMSGIEHEDVTRRCSEKGNVRFLQKPFTPAELTRALGMLLS